MIPPICNKCKRFAVRDEPRKWWICSGCLAIITDENIYYAFKQYCEDPIN